jgi:hypothetical protein
MVAASMCGNGFRGALYSMECRVNSVKFFLRSQWVKGASFVGVVKYGIFDRQTE